MSDKNNKNNTEKDRETYGYGYDRSVDDLKVIGQNEAAKKNNAQSKKTT
ncbi:hypothetical protein MKY34_10100 [Sporosarcina sp. FSL K6-1522]